MVTADDYAPLIDPTRPYQLIPTPHSPARGEGMVTADDYASLIDPIRPDSTLPIAPSIASVWRMGTSPETDVNARRGCNPRTLAQARESGWTPL